MVCYSGVSPSLAVPGRRCHRGGFRVWVNLPWVPIWLTAAVVAVGDLACSERVSWS